MKKALCLVLAACMLFMVACTPQIITPAVPANISIDDNALITWDAVEGAIGYIVKIDNTDYSTTTNSYQASSQQSFTFTVTTVGKDYVLSEQSQTYTYVAKTTPPAPAPNVTVTIVGGSDIKGGKTLQLTANVEGTEDTSVVWSVTKGQDVISVDQTGLVTAQEVQSQTTVEVEARSTVNTEAYATKTLVVGAKPVLTQEMLDQLGGSKVSFNGFVTISAYTIGMYPTLYDTYSMVIKTAMDGQHWYAEYENSVGVVSSLYCTNNNGYAALVGLSYNNTELYENMTDDYGNEVTWESSGYYNNFEGLSVEDFTLNEETWYFDYNKQDGVAEKMISSANPYDFKTDGFSLMVTDGEVSGIYAKSLDDYSVLAGYRCIQELFAVVNTGEAVQVPTIEKYSHEDIHDNLNAAIDKMKALQSYTMTMRITMSSYGTVTQSFVKEYITDDVSLFVPYTVTGTVDAEENRTYALNQSYGYKKVSDSLYNAVYASETGYEATRAYAAENFTLHRPAFDFAGEIFRQYYPDTETGETTYYVDTPMAAVATNFYNWVGNDMALYGMFATVYQGSPTIIPMVTVNADGYITEAAFYFNMTIMYGVVEITFGDFNATTLPEGVSFQDFVARQQPTQWAGMQILDVEASDEVYVDAAEYINGKNICSADEVPFFGNVLGDTFGFVMSYMHIQASTNRGTEALMLYYDVPLDADYTISSSLKAVRAYLLQLGFTENAYGEFNKGDLWVQPTDNNLDLLIYIWKTNVSN